MPRREPTPLRWTEQAEARRVSEKAMLAHHGDEQFPQVMEPPARRHSLTALAFVATALGWLFPALPPRPTERERKWRDSVM